MVCARRFSNAALRTRIIQNEALVIWTRAIWREKFDAHLATISFRPASSESKKMHSGSILQWINDICTVLRCEVFKGVFFWDFETFGILKFADIEAFETRIQKNTNSDKLTTWINIQLTMLFLVMGPLFTLLVERRFLSLRTSSYYSFIIVLGGVLRDLHDCRHLLER